MTEQELADATSKTMHEKDYCAQALNIFPVEVKAGFAKMSMSIKKEMLNGHGYCHGGIIFTLADTSFAHSCNSYNLNTVASGCSIDYIKPAKLKDILTAVSQEQSLSGRTGIYDVTVTNQDNDIIAYFRGRSYRIRGHLIAETK